MKRSLLLLATAMIAWQAQAQNTCATAVAVGINSYYVAAINGSEVPSPTCASGGSNASAGEWYSYTASFDTVIRVTTDLPQNGGVDTRVHVYTGTCGNLSCYAGDDDSGSGYTSVVNFNVTAGTTYYIAFDDNWSASGFTFQVMYAPPPPPPPGGFTAQYVFATSYANCVVDMNADGLDDAVSVNENQININYQLPGGGFNNVAYTTTNADNTPYWSMCAGDLDGNGYNDLVYAGGGLTFMMANDDGTAYTEVSQPEYIFCQRSNLVDINNDGLLDAFSCHDVAPNVYYINNGDGTWTWHQGGLGDTPDGGNYGSIWIDYDNDGLSDMFIAKCRGAGSVASIDQLWHNNGNGTFTDVAPAMNLTDYQQSWSSAWGDFDNDGDMDVMIGASSFSGGGHKLMRNDGTTFTNVTVGSGYDLFTGTSIEFVAQDFNNDGYIDVLGGGALMLNNGDMTFTQTLIPANNGPIGDLNNDGFLDIQNGGTIWMNQGNDNNWINVLATGVNSNTSAIGARIEVTSALGTQIRDIRSGDGFRYMSTLTAHFGLGTDDAVSEVTIKWPDGSVEHIFEPAINGTLQLVEGQSSVGISSLPAAAFSIFPSPAMDKLQLRTAEDLSGSDITVSDLSGKTVLRPSLLNSALDVSTLSPGMYLLKVQGAGLHYTSKFVKQ
jgi:hypothetical protein